jgi:DNA repair exonuclease SbcCD ATPase subunit
VRLIKLKKLIVQNFLSVGEKPIEIQFHNGVNIITGTNYDKEDSKNGVGKSTIADALHFAFFGTTIRELNKDLIVNSTTKKTCKVVLYFEIYNHGSIDKFSITRTIQPTKCVIVKNDIDVTHSTQFKTNDYIQKIIKCTSKIFQNSVIMSINNTVPFMAQSKTDKRKFIESVLNLEVFSEMLLRARDESNELKKEYEIIYTKNETQEKNYNFLKQQIDLFEDHKKQKLSTISEKIQQNHIKIEQLKKDILNIPEDAISTFEIKEEELLTNRQQVCDAYKNILQKKTEIQTNINFLVKQIQELQTQTDICPTCKRNFSDLDTSHRSSKIQEYNNKKQTYETNLIQVAQILTEYENKQKNNNDTIKLIRDKKQKLKDRISTNNNIVSKIDFINETLNALAYEKQTIETENNTELLKKAEQEEQEVINNNNTLKELNSKLDILECVKFVVSEEGVKSYIVKKILTVLNARLAHYLKSLHANCLCQFNEFFDETITDEKGNIKSYFNFSGGERKRIDLACLFAFLDIRRMQGDVHFSTIIYDELLDSSLDDKGVELVYQILRTRCNEYQESCYIITHRGNTILTQVDNVILLEKRNGFTYLI